MTAATAPAPVRAWSRGSRALRLAIVLTAAALLTTSCAAGQHAQTAAVKGSIDGAGSQVGTMLVQGVAIHAPKGSSYAVGSSVQLAVTIINNGHRPDTLVSVTSPAFTSWAIYPNAQATTAASASGGDTGVTVGANSAQRLGLADIGASAQASPRTLLLFGLTQQYAPLYSGEAVSISFHFANAGTATFRVPVQIDSGRLGQTLPPNAGG